MRINFLEIVYSEENLHTFSPFTKCILHDYIINRQNSFCCLVYMRVCVNFSKISRLKSQYYYGIIFDTIKYACHDLLNHKNTFAFNYY